MESLLGLYTFADVCKITKRSRRTIYRYLDNKLFPESGRLPNGQRVWWRADVHNWMLGLFAATREAWDKIGLTMPEIALKTPGGPRKKGK